MKNMCKKIAGLAAMLLLTVVLAAPAQASFVGSPALDQDVESTEEQIEVVTDNVVTGGYIRQKGTAEVRPPDQIDYPVIKITTLAMTAPANAKVDAANPDATQAQKVDIMTESALTYGKNAVINDTADRYNQTDTTSDFLDQYKMTLLNRLTAAFSRNLDEYRAVQIADISANDLAISVANGRSVMLTFAAPGVEAGSRVRVLRIVGDSASFVTATAGEGSISFSVAPNSLGVFMLMVHST